MDWKHVCIWSLFMMSVLVCTYALIYEDKEVLHIKVEPKKKFFQCYAPKTIKNHSHEFRGEFISGDSSLPNVNKKFLVVLHITQDSLGNQPMTDAEIQQVRNDITTGSGYFSRIGISFEASDSVRLVDNPRFDVLETEDELSELARLYSEKHRLNMYIINGFEDDLEGSCGLAGDFNMYMAANCFNPTVFAHETGHVFGLNHTFGTGDVLGDFEVTDELVDGSNCVSGGDFICDTPADPFNPTDTTGIVWIEDCAFIYDGQDLNGDYYEPDLGNIMAYYYESCACGLFFTNGQLRAMADTYLNSTSNYLWW